LDKDDQISEEDKTLAEKEIETLKDQIRAQKKA
jgi:hypothetical protein